MLALLMAACAEGSPADDGTGGDGDGDGDQVDAGTAECPGGGEPAVWYLDSDGDSFGDTASAMTACQAPPNHVAMDGDCDDGDRFRNPGLGDVCDGIDNDCSPATEETCPNNCQVQVNGGRPYLFCNIAATWANARAVCQAQLMDLVRLDDQPENAWVFANAGLANAGAGGVWIRATDQQTEGLWVWADGPQFWAGDETGMPVGLYVQWNPNEPNDANDDEDCAEMVTDGNWNDITCLAERGFICERDL